VREIVNIMTKNSLHTNVGASVAITCGEYPLQATLTEYGTDFLDFLD
jgi:hypothetical protein